MNLGIDFSLILYILLAALVGLGVPYYFLQTGKFYAGAGFLLAALATFIFFGMRWFNGLRLNTTFFGATSTTQSWPPQINYCPDFLSLNGSEQVNTVYRLECSRYEPNWKFSTFNKNKYSDSLSTLSISVITYMGRYI